MSLSLCTYMNILICVYTRCNIFYHYKKQSWVNKASILDNSRLCSHSNEEE